MDEAQFREMYSGKAGEPVPEVDPGGFESSLGTGPIG